MKYLTKSRFKEAIECPDKLFYYRKEGYADNRMDNEFLQELAKYGVQVGELAKKYYPEGVEVLDSDNEKAIAATAELLKKENVTLFEAAIATNGLLARVDILIKHGSRIDLIEVKSKSIFDEKDIFTKGGSIDSEWREYVYDIAFQTYVAQGVFEGHQIRGYLCVIDKQSSCSVDGLYQKFRLKKMGGRYEIVANPEIPLGTPILKNVELTETIHKIIQGSERIDEKTYSFKQYVELLRDAVQKDTMLMVRTGRHCKNCTYKATEADKLAGLKSGYENCWTVKDGFNKDHFSAPSVFDLWNLHYSKLEKFLSEKKNFLDQISKEELLPKSKSKSERVLSIADRQWLQIERANNPKIGPYVDKAGLKSEFKNLKYPLHFIDFEVAMNAIPFLKGLRPYHRLAFQFSHHILESNGKVSHAGQWIETRLAVDPNISFIRQLKAELAETEGSILIYSQFENSILLHLLDVISISNENDKDEIIKFIKDLTISDDERGEWIGKRAMIDMRDWVLNYYLSPHMRNSNSLKVVLPAILNESKYLSAKYGVAEYGSDKIPSLNFTNQRWIEFKDGLVINPYDLLPAVFDGLKRESIELLFDEEELADGGAAMCAFNLMQFMEMSEIEKNAIIAALYKYCELDTLAMVMLYEGLNDLSS